jgi:formate hydrogenlyase transcriptional activator
MSLTSMGDPQEQQLFNLTRTLLQQPDFCALAQALTLHLRQADLAGQAAIILTADELHPQVRYYGVKDNGESVIKMDELALASGPVSHILSRPDMLHCDVAAFREAWPVLAGCGLYPNFSYYGMLPLAFDGKIVGGCEILRDDDRPWSEKERARLRSLAQIVALAVEQIQIRLSDSQHHKLLCRERNDFRLLVAITNAVLSKLDLDELISEIAHEIHNNFGIDSISIVLRASRRHRLKIYSTHYIDRDAPVHDRSEVNEQGTLSERVFHSKKMLLLNLHQHDSLAPYERMLFDMWGNQIQTLCLLPLMSGDNILGVLKLAQCQEHIFTTANLKLLHQIAGALRLPWITRWPTRRSSA